MWNVINDLVGHSGLHWNEYTSGNNQSAASKCILSWTALKHYYSISAGNTGTPNRVEDAKIVNFWIEHFYIYPVLAIRYDLSKRSK